MGGRVCCDQIVPYPPGIPVTMPGQVVEPAVLSYLARLLQTQKSIDLHGLAEVEGAPCLRGLTEVELEALPRLGVD